jgi:ubiquinone/menaquinone biosynthesis C-methylase UbiE
MNLRVLPRVNEGNDIDRVRRTRAEARLTYDRISRWYDLLEGIWEERVRHLALKKLDLRVGERVLEIGCGTGHGVLELARAAGAPGRAYGMDLSPRMLDITRKRIAAAGLEGTAALLRGDAVHLPLAQGALDAVFMSFVLELFDTPEIPLVLSECRRVLCRGGRVCVVSLSRACGASRMRDLYEWGHLRFPRLLDCRPIFVRRALESEGFECRDAACDSVAGLPVELVLAQKQQ